MGSMFAAVIFIGIQNASSVQAVVAIERAVFYRERAAGMYSALPYAFGQVCNVMKDYGSVCLFTVFENRPFSKKQGEHKECIRFFFGEHGIQKTNNILRKPQNSVFDCS